MTRRLRILALVALGLGLCGSARAYDPPVAKKETTGSGYPYPSPWSCRLSRSVNGTCGNYRWYNICSGYIWVYSGWRAGEGVGVLFGGPQQPCVAEGACDGTAILKRVIVYFRNVSAGYDWVDLFLETDDNADGCPDFTVGSTTIDPGERWNCWEVSFCNPPRLIVRQVSRFDHGISFVTDGPYSDACAPIGASRSFYYGINGSACVPWVGPTGRSDNFLTWLIFDNEVTATEPASWGKIKGLFQ